MKIIDKDYNVRELTMWDFPITYQVGMSCLQGGLNATYKDLVYAFGKETIRGDDYKVQAEWNIVTPVGFATIYDYKQGKKYCGNKEGICKSKVTDWHIGGENKNVVDYVIKAFQNRTAKKSEVKKLIKLLK